MTDTMQVTKWRGILEEFERRGGSVQQFCRFFQISPGSLYSWRKKLAALDSDLKPSPNSLALRSEHEPAPSNGFVRLNVISPTPAPAVRVEFACGATLEVSAHEHDAIRLIVRTLLAEVDA